MPPPPLSPAGSGRDAWVAAVAGADDAWLVELFSLRPELLMAGPRDLDDVAESLLSPEGIGMYHGTVDRSTRQVLEALCVLPTPTDLPALAAALDTSVATLRPVVARLRASGLLLPDGDLIEELTLVRNPGLVRAIPHPAGLGGPARELLSAYSVRDLSEIGARLGVVAKGAKASVLDVVVQALSSPDGMAAAVRGGPPGTEELARRLAGDRWQVALSWGMYETSRTDRTPEGWLLRRGMLVPSAWGSATMPAEVALALRGGRLFEAFVADGPPLVTPAVDAGQTDRAAAEAALSLVADVATVLEAWAAEPAKLLRSGGLGVREVRRVAKLTGRTEVAAACLIDLMAAAGLAAVEDDLALPTADYDGWSDQPVGARWGGLAEAWHSAPVHFSLAGATDPKGKPIPALLDGPPETDALARRHAALGLLADLPAGRAVERSTAVAVVIWRMPGLWADGPARPERLVSWILDEAEMLGVTAGGATSSFGRSLISGDRDGARNVLASFSPPVTSEVVIQADLTAVASGELAPDLRRELDLLADVESAGAATVYRFSEASLRRGFDAGRSAEEILTWLADRAPKGVPQPLRYLVDDLARRFGRARAGAATSYIRSDDPALVAEMVRARKTARLGLRLLAPTVAVSDTDRDTMVRVLRDAGYLAAPEEADGVLTLRRPPSRRAAASGGGAGVGGEGREALLEGLLESPEMLAAFVGLPASAVPAGFLAGIQRLLDGQAAAGGDAEGGDAEGGTDQSDDPLDLVALVARLRGASRRRDGEGQPEPPVRGRPAAPPFPQLHLLHDDPERPTHIAKEVSALRELVERALAQDWLVRLSFLDRRGREIDTYADVIEVTQNVIESVPIRMEVSGISASQ